MLDLGAEDESDGHEDEGDERNSIINCGHPCEGNSTSRVRCNLRQGSLISQESSSSPQVAIPQQSSATTSAPAISTLFSTSHAPSSRNYSASTSSPRGSFLPKMTERKHGHTVNVASLAAFTMQARNTGQGATKADFLPFWKGLRQELRHTYNAPQVRTRYINLREILSLQRLMVV